MFPQFQFNILYQQQQLQSAYFALAYLMASIDPTVSTQDITLAFETDLTPSDVVARKYNSITKQYANVEGATITEDTIGGKHVLVLKYQVTDGGELDEDGVANGEIIDPVGLAISGGANGSGGVANTNRASISASNKKAYKAGGVNGLANTGDNVKYLVGVAVVLIAGSSVVAYGLYNKSKRQ
jgi:hypothetical protein